MSIFRDESLTVIEEAVHEQLRGFVGSSYGDVTSHQLPKPITYRIAQ